MRALQLAGTTAFILLMLGVLAWACLSPRFAFVSQRGEAAWITSAPAPSTASHVRPIADLPVTTFARHVSLPEASASLRLEIQALRGFELRVNGCEVAGRSWDEGSWREPSVVEVGACLEPGNNRIEVDVTNHRGPALLKMRGNAGGAAFVSDGEFSARSAGEPEHPAVLANDRLMAREAVTGAVVGPGFQARWVLLGLLFVAGVALAWGAAEYPDLAGRYGLAALFVAAAGLWIWLFAMKFQYLPGHAGFDGPDHLEYVQYLLEHRALPMAYDGHQMYQPPLFYVLSALLVALFGGSAGSDQVVLHVLPFLCGVAQVLTIAALARALYPTDRVRQAAALVVAACIPLNIYMAAYLSNEVAYSALSSLAILCTCRVLMASGTTWRAAAGLGALVGLAVLTKVSALLLLPTMLAFLFVRDAVVGRLSVAASLGRAAVLAGAASLVMGGLLLHNLRLYGSAVIGNWDLPGQTTSWWQTPGFHTPEYFLRLGDVLSRPFFAGFGSFWDGMYSTFFGDGMVGGLSGWRYRHLLWDYDLMAAGYLLAVPAAILLLLGFALLVRRAFREPDLGLRAALAFALTLTVGTVFATLLLNIDHPVYSMAHARYLLCVLAPLTLCLVEGFAFVDTRLSRPGVFAAQIAYRGLAGGLALVWAATFASG